MVQPVAILFDATEAARDHRIVDTDDSDLCEILAEIGPTVVARNVDVHIICVQPGLGGAELRKGMSPREICTLDIEAVCRLMDINACVIDLHHDHVATLVIRPIVAFLPRDGDDMTDPCRIETIVRRHPDVHAAAQPLTQRSAARKFQSTLVEAT